MNSRRPRDTTASELEQQWPPCPVETSQSNRDLEWAIHSPTLITSTVALPVANLTRLQPPEGYPAGWDAAGLQQVLESLAGRRVGPYFERLVGYWLSHIQRLPVIHAQMPLRQGGKTLGEVDFVFRDGQQTVHWETAVKFYLCYPGTHASGSHLIGPNHQDTWERKMTRMAEHQLPLARLLETQIDRSEALVRGRIYYHPQAALPPALPAQLNPAHLKGSWIFQHETELLHSWSDVCFIRIEKPYWLSEYQLTIPESSAVGTTLRTASETAEYVRCWFGSNMRPLHLAAVRFQKDNWFEVERIFVVKRSWPHQ